MSSEARHSQQPSPQQAKSKESHVPQPGPRRGEIWDVNWSPGRGAEQQGTRPALVIQNDRGNASLSHTLDEAYDYLGTLPETLEDARFFFDVGHEVMVA